VPNEVGKALRIVYDFVFSLAVLLRGYELVV
jgi:hypothetical protein